MKRCCSKEHHGDAHRDGKGNHHDDEDTSELPEDALLFDGLLQVRRALIPLKLSDGATVFPELERRVEIDQSVDEGKQTHDEADDPQLLHEEDGGDGATEEGDSGCDESQDRDESYPGPRSCHFAHHARGDVIIRSGVPSAKIGRRGLVGIRHGEMSAVRIKLSTLDA